MKRVDAKFVICRDLQGKLKDDPQFLTTDVTGDDSWCFGYDPESKQQSSQWKSPNSPRPKKRGKFAARSRTFDFCNVDWIVHREFVPPGPTVNQKFY